MIMTVAVHTTSTKRPTTRCDCRQIFNDEYTDCFQQKMQALRELHQQRKLEKPKLINPVINPRYDDVYKEGVVWLDSLWDT